eukprot:700100-Amphidinium_carterae.1
MQSKFLDGVEEAHHARTYCNSLDKPLQRWNRLTALCPPEYGFCLQFMLILDSSSFGEVVHVNHINVASFRGACPSPKEGKDGYKSLTNMINNNKSGKKT